MKKETLKTLKDMNFMKQFEVKDELKQEAIKWIDKERTKHMNANDFILVFFDITEEDLK